MLIVVVAGKHFVCKTLASEEEGEVDVHYFNGRSQDPRKRKYRPVYIDPKDHKEIFTTKPVRRYEAYTSHVPISSVVARGFTLNSGGKVPKKVWDTLPPLPPEEPQPESPTSEGESEEVDVDLTEQGEQMLSPFEQHRLNNIAENERMLQQLGLVSGHGSLNVPDGRGRGRRDSTPNLFVCLLDTILPAFMMKYIN